MTYILRGRRPLKQTESPMQNNGQLLSCFCKPM